MRPVRLELHGFTAFRDETVIDFADADLFALSGPTGAGKSSIIDGMCFALYGSVPRLDRRAVAPVISTGKVEARIRFDFTVGEQRYTAARVVRRTATGATTKEARLECEGTTLAGDAPTMTAAVESLLGLGFDQFTKCVVLPQGDFARFLHDTPSARQELLIKLLELGLYERMRAEANTRKVTAEAALELTEGQLAGLADATAEALAAAADRVEQLAALREEIDETQPQIDELLALRRRAEEELAAATSAAKALRQVAVPDGVAELAATVAAADAAVDGAAQRAEAARSAATAAEEQRSTAGDPVPLQRVIDACAQRDVLLERITRGHDVVGQRQAEEQQAAAARAAAEAEAERASANLEAIRRDHAAHALALTLVSGDPCPVCLQPVATVPEHDAPAALGAAEAARTAALAARDAAERNLQPRRDARAKAEQLLESLREQCAELDAVLAAGPEVAVARQGLEGIAAAEAAVVAARGAAAQAAEQLQQAQERIAATRRHQESAWTTFDTTRDSLATWAPPPADRTDLAGAWATLVAWATEQAVAADERAAAAGERVAQAAADNEAVAAKIAARCEECEVVLDRGARPRDAVADAAARAQAEHRRITDALAQSAQLRADVERHRADAAVAKTLGQHLSARGFEQWLLDEALHRLADGASTVLRELSSGQYSLTTDAQRNFLVTDHHNADEQRPARTLSGGETFLASLSLALSLADHLLGLSVAAEPRLESIFLDEGFGSLDPETLDVVAAAIEELGARGRTVGVVTHVRDLAERMPVRFDVRKGPGGSTVDRSDR